MNRQRSAFGHRAISPVRSCFQNSCLQERLTGTLEDPPVDANFPTANTHFPLAPEGSKIEGSKIEGSKIQRDRPLP
jgi:hypothetical protein